MGTKDKPHLTQSCFPITLQSLFISQKLIQNLNLISQQNHDFIQENPHASTEAHSLGSKCVCNSDHGHEPRLCSSLRHEYQRQILEHPDVQVSPLSISEMLHRCISSSWFMILCRYFVLVNAIASGYTLILLFIPSKNSCGHMILVLDLVRMISSAIKWKL